MNDQHCPLPSASQFEPLMKHRLNGRIRDLSLIIRDGGIVLRGRSSSYYAKQLAQQAAIELTGMQVLANEIEVSAGETAASSGGVS